MVAAMRSSRAVREVMGVSVAPGTGGVKRRMHGARGLSHLPWEIGIRDVIALVGSTARFFSTEDD